MNRNGDEKILRTTAADWLRRFATGVLFVAAMVLVLPGAAHAVSRSQKAKVKRIIRHETLEHGFTKADVSAMYRLCARESGFRVKAANGPCKGLFQLHTHQPRSKWQNPVWNTSRALTYIKKRYGTPRRALAASYSKGWY